MGREGVDLKFSRARRLLGELDGEVQAFLATGPFELEEHEEESSGDLIYRVRVHAQPPTEWSGLVGDIVHNARSALDHLAHALVLQGGGTPDESTTFPVADQPTGYGDKLRRGLRGATPASRDAVRALTPWRGGDDELWRLHRLDIIDKHRLLVPVGAAHGGIVLGVSVAFADEGDGPNTKGMAVHLNPDDRQYPLEDGAEVYRIAKAARGPIPMSGDDVGVSFSMDHSVAIDIAFGEGEIVAGEPVVPTLRAMVEHAAAVVEPLLVNV